MRRTYHQQDVELELVIDSDGRAEIRVYRRGNGDYEFPKTPEEIEAWLEKQHHLGEGEREWLLKAIRKDLDLFTRPAEQYVIEAPVYTIDEAFSLIQRCMISDAQDAEAMFHMMSGLPAVDMKDKDSKLEFIKAAKAPDEVPDLFIQEGGMIWRLTMMEELTYLGQAQGLMPQDTEGQDG